MASHIEIRLICDNNSEPPFRAEHGLALAISAHGRSILLDTGQSFLRENLAAAGLSPADFDTLVISHGHYDHTGGVEYVLSENPVIDVYAHRRIFETHISAKTGSPRYIGMPDSAVKALKSHSSEKLHLLEAPSMLTDKIGLIVNIPRLNPFEDTGGLFYRDMDCTVVDYIEDELSIWIETPEGIVLFTGCCHSGLINSLKAAEQHSGKKPAAAVGGFHLEKASEERLDATVRFLKDAGLRGILPLHCTGKTASERLASEIPAGFFRISSSGILSH